MATWQPAYIGVGSNLQDPRAQVLDGLREEASSGVDEVGLVGFTEGTRSVKP
jgi:7,8-dihydro-6-hydroxymethylpterin-pyrophosphokinase